MLSDVHEGLDLPSELIDFGVVRGKYEFYHYKIDGVDDRVCSKIVHISGGDCVEQDAALILLEHFKHFGSPVMIGGDIDASSKTLLGVCKTNKGFYFLIADPHFCGKADKAMLQDHGWVQWKSLSDVFKVDSFYNFCLPQLRSETGG
ncbi:UFM1 hydrolase [Porites harrisoni]